MRDSTSCDLKVVMQKISVRYANINDSSTIVAFNLEMALETEGKTLSFATVNAGVKNLIRRPEYGFYLVAEVAERVVAALLVTFEWSDWRNGVIWWVQSVFVAAEWRRRGVYRKLYETVKAFAAQDARVRGFRLYVEKDNLPAQQTYRSLGMQESDYRLYEEMVDSEAENKK